MVVDSPVHGGGSGREEIKGKVGERERENKGGKEKEGK
jgi:hypothetical protein